MKKLMIAAVVMAMAAVVNAGNVKWSVTGVTSPSGSEEFSGPVYAFDAADITSDAVLAAITDGTFGDVSGKAAYSTNLNWGEASKQLYSGVTGDYTLFTVVFDDAYNFDEGGKYILSSPITQTVGSSGTKTFKFDLAGASWESYGPVPEPTSGLLLLLGMAGLALRRRRA